MNIGTATNYPRKTLVTLCVGILTFMAGMAIPQPTLAATGGIAQGPLTLTTSFPPIAILNISKSHQLFSKAYSDYSDLDDDAALETTYQNSIDYYGYFDSYKCYKYDNGVFHPKSTTTDKYCTSASGGEWSGNFLNWVSMSRMDIVRKLLYGGKRSTDTATTTILERAQLPTDAHAWAKYYNGEDVDDLTPFDNIDTTLDTYSASGWNTVGIHRRSPRNETGNQAENDLGAFFQINDVNGLVPGDQVIITTPKDSGVTMKGTVFLEKNGNDYIEVYWAEGGNTSSNNATNGYSDADDGDDDDWNGGSNNTPSYSDWKITNLSSTGITFCNVTYDSNGTTQSSNKPPLIRVAKGNFALWSGSAGDQCMWSEERSRWLDNFAAGLRSNGNIQYYSGLEASAENPSESDDGLGKQAYVARVEVCVSGLVGTEKCKQYPNGNYKPVGLLQEFGDDGQIKFGLFTGSYDENLSGGVLRKNAKSFATEVNVTTDGTFKNVNGIVSNLDALRVYGYKYNSSNPYGDGDNCTWGLSGITEGECRSWGNPMSEIYLESLRYLAGLTPQQDFQGNGSAEAALGLTVATWPAQDTSDNIEPLLDSSNYCTRLNVLNFNVASSSYDDDDMDTVGGLGAAENAGQLTDKVGAGEGINGNQWFVGNVDGGEDNDLCSAKTVGGLGDIYGICPAAPSKYGTYLMSGVAWYAHTNPIRSDISIPDKAPQSIKDSALTVRTYGVALAANVPAMTIPVPGTDSQTVKLMPAYKNANGTGTLVDFKIVYQELDATDGNYSGSFYVNWEDSEQGGDFDQDLWGTISYVITNNDITVTTDVVSGSASLPQGFGYVISGTTADGTHFYSGGGTNGYDYEFDSESECSTCKISDGPASATYSIGDSSAGILKDPLWYTAKWGAFKDENGDDKPDQQSEWDEDSNGVPDTFSHATNPLALEQALRDAFADILERTGSGASAATNTGIAITGTTMIYQPLYNSGDWSGDIRAYEFNTVTRELADDYSYSAGESLDAQVADQGADGWKTGREIITTKINDSNGTFSSSGGIPFMWSNLSTYQKDLLNDGARNNNAGDTADSVHGEAILEYLRGSGDNEAGNGHGFRDRHQTPVDQDVALLGDIVNSTPVYVGSPSAYLGMTGYASFKSDHSNRPAMIYVGTNDGMLHAFDAATLNEAFAYVPATLVDKLHYLKNPDYRNIHKYYVDGTPTTADVQFGSGDWRTVLVGTTAGGGKSIFALDITDPSQFGESNASNMVLWEINPKLDSAYAELGYTFSRPVIVKMANGEWAAIFGNGYESNSGKSILYIADIEDGHLIKSFELGAGSDNGLSSPIAIDRNGDQIADRIYAGDLQGNMWAIDVSSSNPSDWETAFGTASSPEPLFKATSPTEGDPQPITVQPQVVFHPVTGVVVLFGTGSYFRADDDVVDSNTNIQSFYGIWDMLDTSQNSVTRNVLQEQTILAETILSGRDVRATSDNAVDWNIREPSSGEMGWYMDFNFNGKDGERVVRTPKILSGNVVFPTLIPFDDPCLGGGTGYTMILDSVTGARPSNSIIDLNGDGSFGDMIEITVGGVTITVPISGFTPASGGIPTSPAIVVDPKSGKATLFITDSLGGREHTDVKLDGSRLNRISWRQLQ